MRDARSSHGAAIRQRAGVPRLGDGPVGARARGAAAVHRAGQTDSAFIESFNSRLREECLNEQVFVSLADGRRKIEHWRVQYNRESYYPIWLCH